MHAATSSLAERISRTRNHQVRALAGVGKQPARPAKVAEERLDAGRANQAANDGATASPAVAGLRNEFEALLPAASRLYGYQDADVGFLRAAVLGDGQAAERELGLVVRQWRIDVVSAGLDGVPGLLTEGAARRARIQFRMTAMGESSDESGAPYAHDALDWEPESSTEATFAPEEEEVGTPRRRAARP